MAWTPEAQVIDLVPVADNLLAYIQANQTDALEWANGGPGLKDFAKFYTNASGRLQTVFPSLMILTQQCDPDLSSSTLRAAYQVTLEGTIGGSDPDTLVLDTKKYAKAVQSMMLNIDSLTTGADQSTVFAPMEIAVAVDITRGQTGANAFIQIFQIRAEYLLITAGY